MPPKRRGARSFQRVASDAGRAALAGDANFQLGLGVVSQRGWTATCGYYTGTIDFMDGPGGTSHPLTAPSGIAMFVRENARIGNLCYNLFFSSGRGDHLMGDAS